MRKSKYSDSQIMAILKQNEDGVPVPDLCREHGMSRGYAMFEAGRSIESICKVLNHSSPAVTMPLYRDRPA